MVKKSLLWVYRVSLWLIVISLVILLVAAVTIHFWLMPNINHFKDDIARFATQATQQKVIIGNLKADWQGFNPHITISNIDIFDAENRPALQLKNTDIGLSWLSIPMLEPHLAELSIRDPELTIRRIASGEIFVAGISILGESKPDLSNWLLRQHKLQISNAKVIWLDEKRNAPSLSLNHLNIELFTPLWRSIVKNHLFTISAQPSIATNNPVMISGNFFGNDVSQMQKWHGNLHIQLTNTDLAAFKPWIDYPINLQSGTGSTEISLKFSDQQIQAIDSNVTLENVQLQIRPDATPIILSKLTGQLDWKNLNKAHLLSTSENSSGTSLSVKNVALNTNSGLNLQDVNADYIQTAGSHHTLNLKLAHLDLGLLQPYLSQLPLPEATHKQLIEISAQGAVDDVDFNWESQNQKTTQYKINAKFSHVSILAYEKLPGFTNLSGEIHANHKNGLLKLNTQNATLDMKGILRWPVPIDTLNGEVNWEVSDKLTLVNLNKLSINNPHLSGVIDAKYMMDGNKGGHLDLKGKFDNANAKYALFYYPTMLGTETLHWLDTSILAGKAEDINLTVKGRLADFPFVDSKNNLDPKLGLFRITAKLSDILLEYGTGWPVIEKLGLNMLFEGKRMELNAHTGRILGNQIIKSKTTIAQLDADNPMLMIDSEVQGLVSQGINFVNKSPVHEVAQGFTDDLKTSGTGKLNLNLKIPMQDLEAAKYKGTYQISNGTLENENIPRLSQINGLLEFTESNLTAKNVNAIAFGSPLAFNLISGKDKSIRITARGKLSETSIRQIFLDQNFPKANQYISGSTDWVGDILIQKPRVSIGIRSDLSGITSYLPSPLNKSATQAYSLRIDKKQDSNSDTLVINLNNNVNTKIVRTLNADKMQLDYADIHFGNNVALLSVAESSKDKHKGLQITGNLDYLDADAWRSVIRAFNGSKKQSPGLPVQKIALKIQALDIFNRRLNQLTISNVAAKTNFETMQQSIQANIQSREISGDMQWQMQKNGKLIARLSNLTIPDAAPDKISAVTEANTQNSNISQFIKLDQDYPALDIVADNFEFNKRNFGAFELNASPFNDNWNIQKLKFITPEGTISADGQWNNWTNNPNTNINIVWDIKDLGKTLSRFGHPDAIKDGNGALTGTLRWPGSPHQFDTTRLSGDLKFEVRKGQILQVQPGVGRLLGLLSLQSLPRRLTLDFRDLFSNGFAFDKINASVKINKGVLRSDNFTMSGPAADVNIKGETDLQKETQHLFVKVMPRISDSISLAALAGGPLAGAVAFLAQKILKDPLNKIASSEYEITGTWDNPQEIKANADEKNSKQRNDSPLN